MCSKSYSCAVKKHGERKEMCRSHDEAIEYTLLAPIATALIMPCAIARQCRQEIFYPIWLRSAVDILRHAVGPWTIPKMMRRGAQTVQHRLPSR